jgi:hypothetical protein
VPDAPRLAGAVRASRAPTPARARPLAQLIAEAVKPLLGSK